MVKCFILFAFFVGLTFPFPSYLQTRNRADPSRTCPPGVCRQVCWRLIGFSVYRLPGQKSGSTVAADGATTTTVGAAAFSCTGAHTEHKAGPPRASAVIQLVNFFIVLKWANYETREMRNETTKTRFTRPGKVYGGAPGRAGLATSCCCTVYDS